MRASYTGSNVDEHLRRVDAKIRAKGKPFCLTNLYVERPCLVIILGLICLIALTWLSLYLNMFERTKENEREFLVFDGNRTKDWDMQVAAERFLLEVNSTGRWEPRTQSMPNWNAVIVYRAKSGTSLMTRDKLTRIKHIEQNITAMKNWKYICMAESVSNPSCHP